MIPSSDYPTSLRDGRYAICGVLGRGAQAATLDAVDKRDGRPVAIKHFAVRGARSWKEVELAEREARVLSSLSHRLLPEAIEHFEEDGALYLVMEKIEGQSLATIGALPQHEVVRFLHDAAEVLDYLHGRAPAIIHRDVKPGNVIQRPARSELGETHPSYVLVDFGSVRASLKPAGGSTVVGTFGYMAPEQFQGRAQPASDVYAVGATALRLLTGIEPEKQPHKGLAIQVRAALGDGIDAKLVAALEAMLKPDPDERAASLRPLLEGLALHEGVDVGARASAPPSPSAAPGRSADKVARAPAPAPPADRPRGQRRRRRHQERAMRRGRRAQRMGRRGSTHRMRGPFFPAVLFTTAIARIVTALALLVVVPTLLTVLSIVFGAGMRRAALRVQRAGEHADRRILDARERALGRAPEERAASSEPQHERQREGRVNAGGVRKRIDEGAAGGEPKRVRVERGVVEEAIDEVEAAVEEAVEEIKRELKPRRRR